MMKKSLILLLMLLSFFGAAAQNVTVAVFSLNDFHGAFLRDDRKNIKGAAAVAQTLRNLQELYPYNVTVSAGDNFGGSYFYNVTKGRTLPLFFQTAGIELSAVGNHEFDDGLVKLADKWSKWRPEGWNLKYVCANVTEKATGKIPSYFQPTATVSIPLSETKQIKVGFVGLATSNTPFQVSSGKVDALSFNGDYTSVVNQYKSEIADSDIRLLLMHVGTNMKDGAPIWADRDSANISSFNDRDFHGLLTGHSHEAVVGTINSNDYPVVQGHWHGNYINIIRFTVDTVAMRVLKAEPEIISVNENIRLDDTCKRFEAVCDSLVRHTKVGGYNMDQVIGTIEEEIIHDRSDKYKKTKIGEAVCRAYAETVREKGGFGKNEPIIGLSHFGSIRSGFPKGTLRVIDAGETLPFENTLCPFYISGRVLKELVSYGFHNMKYGWLQTGWLKIETDANQNVKRLIIQTPGGKNIKVKDNGKYIFVVDSYMAGGGDGYDKKYFDPENKLKIDGLPVTTGAFIDYLIRNKAKID